MRKTYLFGVVQVVYGQVIINSVQTNQISLFNKKPGSVISAFQRESVQLFVQPDYISKCKLESLPIQINTFSALQEVSGLALVYTSHSKFMSPRVIQRWTEEEEERFARLVLEFNRDFKLVARHFANRSYNQVRSHYYNGVHKTAQSEEDSARQMAESPMPSPASTVKFVEEPELSAESPVDQSYFVLFTVFE
ncbi:SANT/Myb_domain [Hexamita inflata]|uniref:SANT/Myb domain n=1 Tax=Hexamita inflata TaxID=28002 RepID=A0AA86U9G4_9EUKA|nr:SANT/Myb domain [Hexamita inflata]